MKVLVTAASKHGSTAEIAHAIAGTLVAQGLDADVTPPAEVDAVDEYDAVILGSAVYSGHWLAPAKALVARAGAALGERPVWLFSSGPVGDPGRKLVQKMAVDPVDLPAVLQATRAREHRLFAGKLDKHNLSPVQRLALALVRGLDGDYRDWAQIEGWAAGIAEVVQASASYGRRR